jgi:hypothetical protein
MGLVLADGPETRGRLRPALSVAREIPRSVDRSAAAPTIFTRLASDQVGIPAELKHINKRRKRNQQGLP